MKDWVGALEDRCDYESNFRPGAPLLDSVGPIPRRGDSSESALESADSHNHPAAYSPHDHRYDDDGLEERIREPGLSGDNSVRHGPPSAEEDWERQEEETLSRLVTVRPRSGEREKRKQLEKEKSRMEAEGGDYGTGKAYEEEGGEEEERKRQEEEETGNRKEDGSQRKQVEDMRQGFQDWDSSGSYF